GEQLANAFQVRVKLERRDAISTSKKTILDALGPQAEANAWEAGDLAKEFGELDYQAMRNAVLKDRVRIVGRAPDDVHPSRCKVGVLPRAHGSALFTRG